MFAAGIYQQGAAATSATAFMVLEGAPSPQLMKKVRSKKLRSGYFLTSGMNAAPTGLSASSRRTNDQDREGGTEAIRRVFE